jgi:peptide/nickel transport system permease protein
MLNAVDRHRACSACPISRRLARGAALQVLGARLSCRRRARQGSPRSADHPASHVLPNIAGVLVVQATIQFALAVLAEAGLSYLGLGTQPPNAKSWGRMLNEAQTFMAAQPWLAIFPGAAIALTRCWPSTCSATACATRSIRACAVRATDLIMLAEFQS